jgi:glycosyltransferase involved in cell wall biosynthesis
MAQGRLLVASDVGGHHELIRDRETGYLFKAGDKNALAESVLAALNQKEQWEFIRCTARRYVEEERNWQRSVERYSDVYAKCHAVS